MGTALATTQTTVGDIAAYLTKGLKHPVSKASVRGWLQSGELKGQKLDPMPGVVEPFWIAEKADVEAFLPRLIVRGKRIHRLVNGEIATSQPVEDDRLTRIEAKIDQLLREFYN